MSTSHARVVTRRDRLQVARSRGAVSGFLLLLLGIWGALIPFVGPYFDYSFTPDSTWTWTAGRFWLEVLPGAAAALAGLVLLTTANRATGLLAGWVGAAAGAWFVVGPTLSRLWDDPSGATGAPTGGTLRQVVEQIGFFNGLGAAIVLLSALAIGRFSVRSVRDARLVERAADAPLAGDRAYDDPAYDARDDAQPYPDAERTSRLDRDALDRDALDRDAADRGPVAADRVDESGRTVVTRRD